MSKFLLNFAGQQFELTGEEVQTVRDAMEGISTNVNARTALVNLKANSLRKSQHLLFLTLGVPLVLTEEPD